MKGRSEILTIRDQSLADSFAVGKRIQFLISVIFEKLVLILVFIRNG